MAAFVKRGIMQRWVLREMYRRIGPQPILASNFSSYSLDHSGQGLPKPTFVQKRFYQIHDVPHPSPNAPRPARPDYEERVWKALNTFDRFPKEKKLTLDTHFTNDMGLDSLDHVELIVALETEFNCEIPDDAAEKLMTPKQMLDYLCEKDRVPEKRGEYGEINWKF